MHLVFVHWGFRDAIDSSGMKLTLAKMLQIGRELLQGVQETTMKVSKSSSKACSHDLVILVATKSSSILFRGKNEHGSCNKAISSGVANRCKSDP